MGKCWLKLVTRNECYSSGLMVKSSIFPTWPMPAMTLTTWLKETPRSAPAVPHHSSEGTAVWGVRSLGRNVTSVNIGRAIRDDRARLQQSADISVSAACGAEGAGKGSGPSALETGATPFGSVTSESTHAAWRVVYVVR
jgi:hypothetical protein